MSADPQGLQSSAATTEALFRRVFQRCDGAADDIARSAYTQLGLYPSERHRKVAEELFALRGLQKYNHIPESILDLTGPGEHQLILFALIEKFDDQFMSLRLPAVLRLAFMDTFHRIHDRWSAAASITDSNDSIFRKDLALCALRLIPAAARSIDPFSGFPRRALFHGNIANMIKAFDYIYRRCKGPAPMMEVHLHPDETGYFSEEGFTCTLRIAQLLQERFPALKGLFGGSWFYDPAVGQVSPHLAYLSALPGARYIAAPMTPDTVGYALKRSAWRRASFEGGHYDPKQYWMILSGNTLRRADLTGSLISNADALSS